MLDGESRVLSLESLQGFQELVEICDLLGFDRERHDGVWHEHLAHLKLDISVTESLTGCAIYTEQREDVTCSSLVDILHLCRVHSNHPRNLDLLAGARVDNLLALLNSALIDSNVCNLSKFGLFQLESKAYEWLLVIDLH